MARRRATQAKQKQEPEMSPEEAKRIRDVLRNSMRFDWLDPHTLQPHDNNPKSHPSVQREAYSDFLDSVGWAGALLYNERTGRLLDGHMRQADALERNLDAVPVLIVDVDEQTEKAILTFYDKIGTLFDTRSEVESMLTEGMELQESLRRLLTGAVAADDLLDDNDLEIDENKLPKGGLDLVVGEAYNYLILLFKTELDWVSAQDHFGLKRVRCAFTTGIGQGRVVDGGKYLEGIYGDEWDNERRKHARSRAMDRIKDAVDAGIISPGDWSAFVEEMASYKFPAPKKEKEKA